MRVEVISLKEMRPYLSTNELSSVIGLSPNTIRTYRATGKPGDVPYAVKMGKHKQATIRFRKKDVLKWMVDKGMLTEEEMAHALA